MHLLYPFAKRFIAGEDPHSALISIQKLYASGFLSSLDILGENVSNREQADAARDVYIDLIKTVDQKNLSMDYSVKLTQMGLDIDKSFCRDNLERILVQAGKNTVRFDMEGSPHTQATLDMCHDLHPQYKNLGQAVQAYLFRSQADVDALIKKQISVRLCKGAYKEDASIAYQSMDDIRENFLTLSFKLLKEGNTPAIATHDEYLLAEILSFISKEKIDPGSFYFEMLYGVGRDLQKTLLGKGFQVRIYTPFGDAWLPYTLRRLIEKKENILFVMKNLFRETFGLRKIK
ncbi:MAG: proline dehydrogenase [Nitrospinaceae bacterium]|nr:MAG: proline dehydrogenase [Nitrospinaceae bacterium]